MNQSTQMNQSSTCLLDGPQYIPAPNTISYCAVPVYNNLTALLSNCCKTTNIVPYATIESHGVPCQQYCNVTSPGLTVDMVSRCWAKSPGNLGAVIACHNATLSSNVSKLKTVGSWVVLSVLVAASLGV